MLVVPQINTYQFQVLTASQVRQLRSVEGNGSGSGVLAQIIDMALSGAPGSIQISLSEVTGLSAALAAKLSATQAADVPAIATADATDLASSEALSNASKASINAILVSLKAAGIMA